MSLLSPLPSLGSSVFEGATSPSTSNASQSSSPVLGVIGDAFGLPGLGSVNLPNASDVIGDAGISLGLPGVQNLTKSFSVGRVAAFAVGILLIGGGVLMFRQTQIVIQGATRTGRRIAEVAAL